jgi:proteasome assembly chaperone (PAC2) family protein
MIAGWPGMGSVALGVVDYLHKALSAAEFAEIKTDPMAALDGVIIEGGIAAMPQPLRNMFYYAKDQDLIIFESEAQIPGEAGIGILNNVLDVAAKFKVRMIYTGAAFPLPVSFKDTPEVYGAVNEKSLIDNLVKNGVIMMESGQISGSNGLILGFAKERKIKAACLLATMPQYAIGLPNPKASKAVIEALQRLLKFKADLGELDDYIKEMEEKMALIEDKVKDVLTIEREGRKPPALPKGQKTAPAYIIEKIEQLFGEAKADRSKAIDLKKELDRWDLYKLYEDRFLDLFKKGQ